MLLYWHFSCCSAARSSTISTRNASRTRHFKRLISKRCGRTVGKVIVAVALHLQAVDFQALRAHTAELLENGFRANDQLFSSDYYDVRPDSTCYIWLNGSENDADTPVSVATGYLNIRKSSPDAENKWMLRVDLWQEGGARVRMDVDAKTRWECVKLMNQRIVTLFTEFRIP